MELSRGSLPDSLGKLVNNEARADVRISFKNSDVKYFAHKLILSARSNVFHTMFFGAVKEVTTDSNEFEITDVEPQTFMELLKFMYTDQINLNDNNFYDILYASHKYHIEYLDAKCADFLNDYLDKDNVCSILNDCLFYGNAVTEECLMFVDWAIDDLIMLNKLEQLNDLALQMVAKRDTLLIKEIHLFKYLILRSKNSSGTNESMPKRTKMESIFDKIRFPTMSVDQFSECFKLKPEIFSPEQISGIFKYCSTSIADDSLMHSTKKRQYDPKFNGKEINVIEFAGARVSAQKQQELEFRVHRPLAICGIELTAPSAKIVLSEVDRTGKYVTLWEHQIRMFGTDRNAIVPLRSVIMLLPKIKYVLKTHSDCGNKLMCERVAPNAKFNNFFVLPSAFSTIVKNLSFKLPSRQ